MLLPYISDPDTASRIPSISTGGAAINATMKQIVAASRQGIMRVEKCPRYRRLFVLVTQFKYLSHKLSLWFEAIKVVVIKLQKCFKYQCKVRF
jgi:hypothetical protein